MSCEAALELREVKAGVLPPLCLSKSQPHLIPAQPIIMDLNMTAITTLAICVLIIKILSGKF